MDRVAPRHVREAADGRGQDRLRRRGPRAVGLDALADRLPGAEGPGRHRPGGHQPAKFGVDDEVTLLADVKNVEKLRVKIYEINAFNVYLATGREVSTGLALDGLVAGSEQEHVFRNRRFAASAANSPFPN